MRKINWFQSSGAVTEGDLSPIREEREWGTNKCERGRMSEGSVVVKIHFSNSQLDKML